MRNRARLLLLAALVAVPATLGAQPYAGGVLPYTLEASWRRTRPARRMRLVRDFPSGSSATTNAERWIGVTSST